jgi:hypothetical protein
MRFEYLSPAPYRPMNIRLRIVLVVVVLLCALTTLEFPELVRLSDDTSNDFSFTVSDAVNIAVSERQSSVPVSELAPKDLMLWPFAEDIRHDTAFNSPSDLLALHCIHRT